MPVQTGQLTLAGVRHPAADGGPRNLLELFGDGQSGEDKSLYIVDGQNLYEIPYSLINRTDSSEDSVVFEWSAAGRVPDGLAAIVQGRTITFAVADAFATVSNSARSLWPVMQLAVVDLVKVRLAFDALDSFRDGTYQQMRGNYNRERQRILDEVKSQLSGPGGFFA